VVVEFFLHRQKVGLVAELRQESLVLEQHRQLVVGQTRGEVGTAATVTATAYHGTTAAISSGGGSACALLSG
jgi:hypothetical protein